jgi:hypothetical protein
VVEAIRLWVMNELILKEDGEGDEQEVVKEVFERPRFATYTPVTVDTFMRWKEQF